MAEDAAEKMTSKEYDSKIEKLRKIRIELGDKLAKELIPKDIFECAKKHPAYFKLIDSIRIIASDCWSVQVPTSNRVPVLCVDYFRVTKDEYEQAREIKTKIERNIQAKQQLHDRISDTLVALKTSEKVAKEFPEAIPFLDLQEKCLPALKIDDLRDMFKNK